MAQSADNISLDADNPISLVKNVVSYAGRSIHLGPKTLLLDGKLTDSEAAASPYVFNNLQAAVAALTDGTEAEPMTLLIAPYVYWADDPDDPATRVGQNGREPFGMTIRCQHLHLTGLTPDPENVVLASNRGQTQGAIGNFTMFDFWGDGLTVKNLTMGNFCNVDLDYKLCSSLSRPKRMAAITQAHVAYCHGDKVLAENVRFISRLNMNPLNGARRILFNHCHTESTDDALTGTGVFLNCSVDFYGTKPFYCTDKCGAVFINSDLYVRHSNADQYFCKAVGALSIVDSRIHSSHPVRVGWTSTPPEWLRCYQYGVTLNGQPYTIGECKPHNTVALDGRKALSAFRLMDGDSVVYNVYNLLRGDDDWDPLGQKAVVERLSRNAEADYSNMPSCLTVSPQAAEVQTGSGCAKLTAALHRHSGYTMNNSTVHWRIVDGGQRYVRLSSSEGLECTAEPINHTDTTRCVTIVAYTDDGLEGAAELTVAPDFVAAPTFTSKPKLTLNDGQATLSYSLDLEGRTDESLITWYRCRNKNGSDKIAVAVSRLNKPLNTYHLTRADVGYYLMATIQPKHLRCLPGDEYTVVTPKPVKAGSVIATSTFYDDFMNLPTANQHKLLPGFWTVEGYKPADTAEFDWAVEPDRDYWAYGYGINGTRGTGLLQIAKGARLLYTPVEGSYGDMSVVWRVDPAKTAGQGFGSATGQYLDLYIKFDTNTLTGYALRIIRTTKYSHAVDFLLVRYDHGTVTPISTAVSATCYRTDCTISLKLDGRRLTAHAETSTPLNFAADDGLQRVVDLEADVEPNTFGGFGCQHTGSWGESATMIHSVTTTYSK
jgi:hypothetical protein